MLHGKKYFNKDVVYITFKKHPCPRCGNQLKTVKVSKVVNSKSPEAKNFDFPFGGGRRRSMTGNVKFTWKEFECPECATHFTVEELKKIEGIEISGEDAAPKKEKKKRDLINCLILLGIGFVIALILYFIK